MLILDAESEVVIIMGDAICLAVSKIHRGEATWSWSGRRLPAKWGRC